MAPSLKVGDPDGTGTGSSSVAPAVPSPDTEKSPPTKNGDVQQPQQEEVDSSTMLLPLSEVVVGFGSADPNEEDAAELAAAEAAEKESDESGTVKGGGVGGRGRGRTRRPWERLNRSLNPAAEEANEGRDGAVFLWYRRGMADESLPWSSTLLTVSWFFM